jgi:hypothetical protein
MCLAVRYFVDGHQRASACDAPRLDLAGLEAKRRGKVATTFRAIVRAPIDEWCLGAYHRAPAVLPNGLGGTEIDWLLHMLGGAAIAFFFYRIATPVAPFIGALRPLARACLALGLSCAAAIAWEVAEFLFDIYIGTHTQYGLTDTMST